MKFIVTLELEENGTDEWWEDIKDKSPKEICEGVETEVEWTLETFGFTVNNVNVEIVNDTI